MNLAKLGRRLLGNADPAAIARAAGLAGHLADLAGPAPEEKNGSGLEVRIADDFAALPEDVADEYWAEALEPADEAVED